MDDYQSELLKKNLSLMTDKEINEKIAFELTMSNYYQKRIMKNVVFFFWMTIISIALSFFAYHTYLNIFEKLIQ